MNKLEFLLCTILAAPLVANGGMIDDAREKIRQEQEARAVASLGGGFEQERALYMANPSRLGKKCYIDASAHWSSWSGMPKAEFAACDGVVRQEIINIRDRAVATAAMAKAERGERRKGMSEVAAKLDEIDERQAEREKEMDRRDLARQAASDDAEKRRAKTEAIDADLARSKRRSCALGNGRDC